ncbi:MAG: 2-dehydropantoate 2-reductase [Rhodospirillaceae bacterium]
MKFCVFGAGAVGGFVGGMVARSAAKTGAEVSLVARGAHLDAMRRDGLTVETPDETFTVRPVATGDAAELGPQDVVFLSAKAWSLGDAAAAMQPLLGPDTVVVSAQNGIPFWYFHAHGGPLEDRTLQSVDPGGRIAAAIGCDRVVGCVVNSSNEVVSPGRVRNLGNRVFMLGEPDGTHSPRIARIAALLETAGIRAPVSADLRMEIWVKLWTSVSFSAISALTGSTMAPIVAHPELERLGIALMEEAKAVGEALGIVFSTPVSDRVSGPRRTSPHKTSILQDLERGRPMEVDCIAGAVVELGRLAGVATPLVDMIYALVRQRARSAGLYTATGFDPLTGSA